MKKLSFLLIAASLFLAACNNDAKDTSTEEVKEEKVETTEKAPNVAGDVMVFFYTVSQTINGADADLNAFEDAQGKGELPTGAELTTMQTAAATSALAAKTAIEGLVVPAELEAQKADIEAALADYAAAYQMKADALAADGNLEAANAAMTAADEKMNAILDSVGLAPSSISNEVAA